MEKLEKKVKVRAKKENLKKIILHTISAVGVLSVALVAPKAAKLFVGSPKQETSRLKSSFSRLLLGGYVKLENTKSGKKVRHTEKGEKYLRVLEGYKDALKEPKSWDKKWRIIIFDIKEKHKNTRDKIRHTLKGLDFVELQRSVYVFPYDCEDLMTLLKADFKIGKEVLYIIAEEIENDKDICNYFGLERG